MSPRLLATPLKAILFDLDDTLIDSFQARVEALQQAFTGTGVLPSTAVEFLRNLKGGQLMTALAQLETEAGSEYGLIDRYRNAYWNKEIGVLTLYPGVEPLLRELHSRGVKLGVVTQKGREFQVGERRAGAAEEMAELGISDMFSVIVGFEDVSNYKPHPEGVNLALRWLGVTPYETLVVGDSAADIGAARAAGCWSCQATWGIPEYQRGDGDFGADMVAETPDTLMGLPYL